MRTGQQRPNRDLLCTEAGQGAGGSWLRRGRGTVTREGSRSRGGPEENASRAAHSDRCAGPCEINGTPAHRGVRANDGAQAALPPTELFRSPHGAHTTAAMGNPGTGSAAHTSTGRSSTPEKRAATSPSRDVMPAPGAEGSHQQGAILPRREDDSPPCRSMPGRGRNAGQRQARQLTCPPAPSRRRAARSRLTSTTDDHEGRADAPRWPGNAISAPKRVSATPHRVAATGPQATATHLETIAARRNAITTDRSCIGAPTQAASA